MGKALILTLGFEEKFCYRAILRHGIEEGDRVILITAGLIDKVRKAYENIKTFIYTSFGEKVKVELLQIDVKEFSKSAKKLIEKLLELKDYELIINLSGGMRALIIIVLFSVIISRLKNIKVEIELEDLSGVINIPEQLINLIELGKRLTDERIKILMEIGKGCNDVRSLATRLNKDESTIRRNIGILEELKLVEVSKRKPLIFKLTDIGEVIIHPREISEK